MVPLRVERANMVRVGRLINVNGAFMGSGLVRPQDSVTQHLSFVVFDCSNVENRFLVHRFI
jgi:hypothetical protein